MAALAALLLFLAPSQAAPPGRTGPKAFVVLSAELDQPGGRESLSLRLAEKECELAVNTNLDAGPVARLGVFAAPTSELLRADWASYSVESLRLERTRGLRPGPPAPFRGHRFRYRIDGVEVEPGDLLHEQLARTFALAWKSADWKPRSAVEVSWEKGALRVAIQGKAPKTRPPARLEVDAACRPLSRSKVRCRIPGFGYAYLTRP